jgi:hypothetical protein
MAKAIQCPACGRKHPVSSLPDAPTFNCEGCGKSLKVPAQFRPSAPAGSGRGGDPGNARPEPTAALPKTGAPAAAAAVASASAGARARVPTRPARSAGPAPGSPPVARPLRVLAWAAALALGLVVTVWLARVSGWLSGDRLVDVFTGTGLARYLRVMALAPAWALFTTLFLSLFFEGGPALARRRKAARSDRKSSSRWGRRRKPKPVDAVDKEPAGDVTAGDGQQSRRTAARRAAR